MRAQVEPVGIVIEKIYYIGPIRLPDEVQDKIDAKIQANQIADQKRNEVAQAEADADKKVADARGDADSKKLRVDADTYEIEQLGQALRRNPEVIKLEQIKRWDGVYPKTLVTGDDGGPFLMLNAENK